MKRKIIALTTAATLTLVAMAPMAQAMTQEFNMLTGAVYNELVARGLPTDNIQSLTLGQLALIKAAIDSDDSEGKITQNIKAIIER